MKKMLIFFMMALLFTSGSAVLPGSAWAKAEPAPGSIIKAKNNPTIYYVAEDGKRYVFPNGNTFFSWYDDFSTVSEVSEGDLYTIPLGGNVTYKPGALLLKIQTDPKVYAVENNGLLRWVKTEALARELYGDNWNKMIDDVPDSFFTNYTVGNPIINPDDFDQEALEQYLNYSYSKGLKRLAKIQEKKMKAVEKKCERLERSVNRLQKRLERWGMTMPSLGEDFVDQCIQKNQPKYTEKKITVCHVGDDGSLNTISIGLPALKAHFKHGDTLGACSGTGPNPDPSDKIAPIISAINSTPFGSRAMVYWNTDEASTYAVQYAPSSLDTAPTSSIRTVTGSSTATTTHSVELPNLATSTTYYYKVTSKDAAGNTRVSDQRSFVTLSADPDNSAPAISGITATTTASTATIAWITNEAATGKVYYATSSLVSARSILTSVNSSLSTAQSFTLNGLATSTVYYFKVESADFAANTATSTEATFTTLAE
jgi:hypothetical protein